MSRIPTIIQLSHRATSIQRPTKASPEKGSYAGVLWRRFICAENTTKPSTSTPNQALDQYCRVNNAAKICPLDLSAHANQYWLVTSKYHRKPSLGFPGAPSLHCMYSSDARTESTSKYYRTPSLGFPGAPSLHRMYSSDARTESTGASEVGITDDGGSTCIDMSEIAHQSTIDASTSAGRNMKQLSDFTTFHVQELFGNHQDLEKVIVSLGGTLIGTAMAWFVMPIVLRKLHKYVSEGPRMTLWGVSTRKDKPYHTSLWGALEDPAKYIVTFMAFSQMAAAIAPSISAYLPQAWKGAFAVSFVWFLHRWKTNFIANAMANQAAIGTDRERLSAFDKVSSLGLIALGVIALAEACGVPVQSIITVGGVGGVATAFAARDILGNMLSGFSLQFSKPFSVGDHIKAGSIEGQVVEIGLTSTSLINPEKLPVVVPNSLFSSQMIVNRSRALWHVSLVKLPVRLEDIEKIPTITEEIKTMLMSNPIIDVPYCYLSRLEMSHGELSIGCNIKSTKKEEWSSTEQEILLKAAIVVKRHQLGSAV
ncbi:hypothetical protein ACP4OV_006181 [Aristida adscensionis]